MSFRARARARNTFTFTCEKEQGAAFSGSGPRKLVRQIAGGNGLLWKSGAGPGHAEVVGAHVVVGKVVDGDFVLALGKCDVAGALGDVRAVVAAGLGDSRLADRETRAVVGVDEERVDAVLGDLDV